MNTTNEANQQTIALFNNNNLTAFIAFLTENNIIANNTPQEIATLLYNLNEHLNKQVLSQTLGGSEDLNRQLLEAFLSQINFNGLELDNALRQMITIITLPPEAQQIDRIIEVFAREYHAANPDVCPDSDTVYVLSYSMIMLSTDAHSDLVQVKMSLNQFMNNTRGIWGPQRLDPPRVLLEDIYTRITNQPLIPPQP
eukprot:TRINITY_DN1723_c0_g1_i6.p1 TRINITY_DN1723_c0_g1~~TRINITY_DN1723_c0_g1_i6.p1  ORF type:complete len:197 (-),score=28.57 TRINITY_DN1723_c0_g1_i6:27-617(-)